MTLARSPPAMMPASVANQEEATPSWYARRPAGMRYRLLRRQHAAVRLPVASTSDSMRYPPRA